MQRNLNLQTLTKIKTENIKIKTINGYYNSISVILK